MRNRLFAACAVAVLGVVVSICVMAAPHSRKLTAPVQPSQLACDNIDCAKPALASQPIQLACDQVDCGKQAPASQPIQLACVTVDCAKPAPASQPIELACVTVDCADDAEGEG
jgi:hypothetical protein